MEELKALLAKDPSLLEKRSRIDTTPLLEAARIGNPTMVKYLLDMGANYKAVGLQNSLTALHCAAIEGDVSVAKLLVIKGCDVNAISLMGETPLDVATKNGNIDFAKFLREHGGLTSVELSRGKGARVP